MVSLIGAPGIEATTPRFRVELVRVANALGLDPDYLATVISQESGFDPQAKNRAGSSAVGLIQFTQAAREPLGVTRDQILGMSAEEQLGLVARHYAPYAGRLRTLEDAYLAVFYPWGIGKSLDTVLMPRPGRDPDEYTQNKGYDFGGKGYITVADVTRAIRGRYKDGLARPRVPVEGTGAAGGETFVKAAGSAGAMILFGILGAFLLSRKKT